MADADCLRCHAKPGLKASDGDGGDRAGRGIGGLATREGGRSQCHSDVNASKVRACETVTHKVDCSKCHEEVGQQYQRSTHGQLFAKQDSNAPTCKGCHHHRCWGGAIRNPGLPHQRAGVVCPAPREGQRAALPMWDSSTNHFALHGKHSRQGAAEERLDRDRHLYQLSHRTSRAAENRIRSPRSIRKTCPPPAAPATTGFRSSSLTACTRATSAIAARSCRFATTATPPTRSAAPTKTASSLRS